MAIIMSATRGQVSQILECLLAIEKPREFFLAFTNPPALDKRPESPEIGKSKGSGIAIDQSRVSSSSFSLGVYSTLDLP